MKPFPLVSLLSVTLWLIACEPSSPTRPSNSLSMLTLDSSASSAFARSTDSHGVTRIYQNTFDTAPGPEWSVKTISKTPKDARPYLGDFASRQVVTLALADLPQHDLVRVTFDLFLFNGWNGSSPYWGFSRWDIDLADGRNLIHTSFGNEGWLDDRLNTANPHNEQAFPDTYPIRIHPGFTGASEKGTLRDGKEDESSVYHMVLTFPHSDRDITFGFHSVIQEGKNRFWGLANVSVETLPAPPVRTDADLAALWKTLGDVDAVKAFNAQWELAAAGDQAVDYIARHKEETIDPIAEEIDGRIKDLETVDEEHLSETLDQITHQGAAALKSLRENIARNDLDDDYKKRLNAALYIAKRHNANATQLRLFRACQLLEIVHTRPALALKLTLPEPIPRNVDAPNPTPDTH